jgi:sec-independent protein translocase protein TatA
MRLGTLEIIGILLVVLLIFGPGRIAKVAGELGKGIKEFKDGLGGDKQESHDEEDNRE